MIKPDKEFEINLKSLLVNKQIASIFFNTLLNLNKFLNYERRDPYRKEEDEKNNMADYS
jgi:hypothetical protein